MGHEVGGPASAGEAVQADHGAFGKRPVADTLEQRKLTRSAGPAQRHDTSRLARERRLDTDALAEAAWDWPARYARWELDLLTALGFGLDLASCGATGATEDLAYVSPRSGRAVSHEAGGAWADKLLPLPGFLIGPGAPTIGAVREALRLTGFFLEHRACPALGRDALPEARGRLVRLLENHEMVAPG